VSGGVNGRAAFLGAAFLTGVGLIFVVERVGAPDGLVRALGPLLILAGVALLGAVMRNARAAGFFLADRAAPPFYAGLGFAGIAAGLVHSLGAAPPLAGVGLGLALSALAVGPLLRRLRASSFADLAATRFRSARLGAALAVILVIVGLLCGAAGFEGAVRDLAGADMSRRTATIVSALTLIFVLIPGGLAGLVWSAATAAAVLLAVLLLPILPSVWAEDFAADAFQTWRHALEAAAAPLAAGDRAALGAVAIISTAAATAALPIFAGPAASIARSAGSHRAGLAALIVLILIGAASLLSPASAFSPALDGLNASALALASLMLAAAGLNSAVRAVGRDATRAPGAKAPPVSQTLARARLGIAAGLALSVAASWQGMVSPGAALAVAGALALAALAPPLALAFSSRADAMHAALSVIVSAATAAALTVMLGPAGASERMPVVALASASAGFAAGWAAGLVRPSADVRRASLRDMFARAPLDPGT
jgi:hypothetical protein